MVEPKFLARLFEVDLRRQYLRPRILSLQISLIMGSSNANPRFQQNKIVTIHRERTLIPQMVEADDIELLRKYAQEGSEEAFTALVARYIGLVYSAAAATGGGYAPG
jgi:hypothetical protein